jgi:hypothetical protein
MAPPDAVVGHGLPGHVAGALEQCQGVLGVAERFRIAFLLLGQPGQGVGGLGLADGVADFPAQGQALGQVGASLVVIAEHNGAEG